jgi:hypothetical protein
MQITKKLMLDYVEFLKRFAASHITDEQYEKNGSVPPDVILRDMINHCLWFQEPKFKIGDVVIQPYLRGEQYIVYGYHIVKKENGELTLLYVISENVYTGALTYPENLLLLKKDKPYYKWDRELERWIDQRFSSPTGWTPSKESIVLATTRDETNKERK